MAPTPAESILSAAPSPTSKPDGNYWSPANIAVTVVASALFLGFVLVGIAFIVYKHRQRQKIAQNIPAKESLLEGDERKSSMFSRERASSVTVYVDQTNRDTAYKGIHTEPTPLAPLHINTQAPVSATSAGSGVSAVSRNSNSTLGTLMLSPASDNPRASRPRSTSTSSVRYYAVTPIDTTIPVPTIVRTISD